MAQKKRLYSRFPRARNRDRTGMEVNPLVFETSASTNSAIRAGVVSTGRKDNTKLFSKQIIC